MKERKNDMNKTIYNFISSICFGLSTIFILLGFNKLFVYENNSDYIEYCKNAYVGSDAYNYMINKEYATAYFVLAILFVIIAMGTLIIKNIKKGN